MLIGFQLQSAQERLFYCCKQQTLPLQARTVKGEQVNRPLFFQLPAANPELLADFYVNVFGWQKAKLPGPEDMFVLATGPAGKPGLDGMVMGKYMEGTVNIISVDDLSDIMEKVEKAGGRITTPRTNVPGQGDFCWCKDTDDNYFTLMQLEPGKEWTLRRGIDESAFEDRVYNRPVHFEIPANDIDKLAQFYHEVFGWEFQKWSGPIPYVFLMTGPESSPGIDGAIMEKGNNLYPVNILNTENLDDSLKAVTAQGGSILMPSELIPGVGYFAYALDPDGNQFGLMQFSGG